MATSSLTHPARAPIVSGWRPGRLKPLVSGWSNVAITAGCAISTAWLLAKIYVWAWADAVFRGDAAACRAASGACWAFVRDKIDFLMFGFVPEPAHWRVVVVLCLIATMIGASLFRAFWGRALLATWVVALVFAALFLQGDVFGLTPAPLRTWSGLVVTVWIAVVALATAYPLGLILALGRMSQMRVVRLLSIGWIEVVRGVPLISILFLASIMVPLFLPEGVELEVLVRAQVGFTIFGSAYLAEIFRAGLQSVPKGQSEGATALALTHWQALRLVVLPQALKAVIPAQVNTFIMIFKDTSLVLVIGIFDLLGTFKASLSDPAWLGFSTEAYVAGAAFYFAVCFGMSLYSRRLEATLSRDHAR